MVLVILWSVVLVILDITRLYWINNVLNFCVVYHGVIGIAMVTFLLIIVK